LGIQDENAKILSKDPQLAALFEAVSQKVNPSLAAKWIRREVLRIINLHKKQAAEVKPEAVIKVLQAVQEKKITDRTAIELLEKVIIEPFDVSKAIEANTMMQDNTQLTILCKATIQAHPQAVEDYKKGQEKSFNFLVGQVMKETKGKADPTVIKSILKSLL